MARSKPSHEVCLQLLYVDSLSRVCLQGVVRDRNLRCGRVLGTGPASLAQLTASVAQELRDSMLAMRFAWCCGPRYRPRWSISRLI